MAIEDEIVNISDLDIGNEILKTDKLIVETNNGTRLLDFKDFVIGIDNISFYHLISGRGDVTGIVDTEILGGHTHLTTDTSGEHKPNYSDLKGTVELTKRNYNALFNGTSSWSGLSASISQNAGDIQNILATLSRMQNMLEQPVYADLVIGSTIRMLKVKSYKPDKVSQYKDLEWYDGREADLEVVTGSGSQNTNTIKIPARLTTDTSVETTNSVNFKVSIITAPTTIGNTNSLSFNRIEINPSTTNTGVTFDEDPFSIKYPTDTTYVTSTISFNAFIKIQHIGQDLDNNIGGTTASTPITINKGNGVVRQAYPTRVGNAWIYDFNFVDSIGPGDVITLKYNVKGAKVLESSSFSGVRMF